jgi:nuclear transport factor 2 (NTF2) superfamily protein
VLGEARSPPHVPALEIGRDQAFLVGEQLVVAFLTQKWERELDYALRKNLWAFDGNRIGVRFAGA